MSNNHKKILSFTLICVMLFSAIGFSGCSQGNNDYPVTVGNIVFDSEPENIVVLSDNLADIISHIGYDVKMVGKSDSVTQKELEIVPSVGNECTPDSAKIISASTDIVFYDSEFNETTLKTMESNNIKAVNMVYADTPEELMTVYRSLGTMLGGATTGKAKGEAAYNDLINSFEETKAKYSSGQILNTVCYLYMENGELKISGKGTYIDMLLGYTGAVNVAVDTESMENDLANLKISNPTYIFYSEPAVIDYLKSNNTYKNLSALKDNKIMEIPYEQISLQGFTAVSNLDKMLQFMYKGITPTEETVAVDANATDTGLANKYNIFITDEGLKLDDENDNVKAMQTRLFDLGYISNKDNVIGYYGPTTEKAVKAFQKNSNLEETGTADKATLDAMFMDNAAKADAPVDKES